jgi:hypothetical protein
MKKETLVAIAIVAGIAILLYAFFQNSSESASGSGGGGGNTGVILSGCPTTFCAGSS